MSSTNSPTGSLKLYLRLLVYLGGHKFRAFLAILCMILSALSTGVVMKQLEPIMNETFLKSADPQATFSHLLTFVIPVTGAAALLRAFSTYGKDYLTRSLSQVVIQKLRNNLFNHFLTLPMTFFDSQRVGGLAARITNDVQILEDSVFNVVGQGLSSCIMAVTLVAFMAYTDWELTVMALVVFPLTLGPIYHFGRRVRKASGESQQLLADMNAHIHETLSGIRVVKAFGMEHHEKKKFEDANRSYFGTTMRRIRAIAVSSPLVEFITTLVLLGLLAWVAHRSILEQNVTVGIFTSFFAMAVTLFPRLKDFNGLWAQLQQAMASAERCFQILDIPDPMTDSRSAVEAKPLRKAIEFKKVNFEYLPGHPVLKDISFSIHKGQRVALVGPSGGGKSTLADLIPRFYQPTSGKILWDGEDLTRFKLASLREQIGIVTQETILFHDSVLRNIAYGRPGASFWDVQEAAKHAYALDFIKNTPQGFNTPIGERGVKLSGGQRQRLAIARALLKNPPVLILDEATSALDTESEHLVQKALEELMGHRTTLVIAHRLSTIHKAD
ncbi:MAG TPA: ABC transporter ATP-binding protein, partial [bacterium]|nr:ABC transporter ATP-binding protein [bacterium]